MQKKKNMALKLTLSDKDSDGSQEEENLVSNQVAFSGTFISSNHFFIQGHSGSVATNTVSLSAKSDTVAIEGKSTTSSSCDSDSDYGDEFEKDDESL